MAHARCLCGYRMSNVSCPSDDILMVFRKKDVETAIKENPKQLLVDFEMESCQSEYWYCHSCKRIYDYYAKPPFIINRIYSPIPKDQLSIRDLHDDWEELYVFSDRTLSNLEIQGESIGEGIGSFFSKYSPNLRYFVSPNSAFICGVSRKCLKLNCAFGLEFLGGQKMLNNQTNGFVYGCACGQRLLDSDIIYLISHNHLSHDGTKNADASVINDIIIHAAYEYWYCPKCERLHEVENRNFGHVVKVYNKSNIMFRDLNVQSWEQYDSFRIDNTSLPSKMFIPLDSQWMISPCHNLVASYSENQNQITHLFSLEWKK